MIRRVEGSKFLGVWVDEGLKWTDHIGKVKRKTAQLLGVVRMTSAVLEGGTLLTLYNSLVLPHLQYCLLVWGDFKEGRNLTQGEQLLRYQKSFARLAAGRGRGAHADPLLADQGMLKIGDLYKQQLRIHAWQFWNGKLPVSQASMLSRAEEVHNHATRAAERGLYKSTRDHRAIAYRVPNEWASLTDKMRGTKSLAAFKKKSKLSFINQYKSFNCTTRGCRECEHIVQL